MTALPSRVPNKPKTPIRGFRIPDEVYLPAQEAAGRNEETVTDVVVRALKAYARRNRSASVDAAQIG